MTRSTFLLVVAALILLFFLSGGGVIVAVSGATVPAWLTPFGSLWTELDWMAWTIPTAIFFVVVFSLIALMGVWERVSPGGGPRVGVLGIETTRGDRLFLSLLVSAFATLVYLSVMGPPLWGALGVNAVIFVLVFLFV